MKPVSDATARVTAKNFSRKFVSIGRIVKAWPEIMGAAFADKALPNRIQYRKPGKKNDKPIATLEIATSHADATLMHYQKDVILERIAHIFGERWINDIKFVAVKNIKTASKLQKKRPRPLTQSEKNHLSNMLGSISDPLVYERLQSLGENILKQSEKKNEG